MYLWNRCCRAVWHDRRRHLCGSHPESADPAVCWLLIGVAVLLIALVFDVLLLIFHS